MRQTYRVACRLNTTSAHLVGIVLLLTALFTGCAKLESPDNRVALQERYRSVCITAGVALGKYRIPAFEKASVRAMAAALADSSLVQNCTSASLQLHYRMVFGVEPFSWKAKLLVSDATGKGIWRGTFHGKNNQRAALQYLIENTAVKLFKDALASP